MRVPRLGGHAAALLIVSVIVAGGSGCSGAPDRADDPPDATVRIDTVGGIVRVRNVVDPPGWTAREVLSVGSLGGPEAASDQFGRVTAVIADSAGLVYVADALANEIRVFDRDGAPVRTIGSAGRGPGEFGYLQSIGWLGDQLMALDGPNARIGLLSAEGEWLGQRPHMALTGSGLHIRPTGSAEVYTPTLRSTSAGLERFVVRHTPEGFADTLPNPRVEDDPRYGIECEGQGLIWYYTASFAPRTLRIPAPAGRFARVWSAEYRIAIQSAAGDTVRLIERDLQPQPVPDSVFAADEAELAAFHAENPGARCEPERMPRPPSRDLIREIVFDDRGNMWVEVRTEAGFAMDAYDTEGRLLGRVPVPERDEAVLPYVRDGSIYLVTQDALEVQYVRVLELDAEAREGLGLDPDIP